MGTVLPFNMAGMSTPVQVVQGWCSFATGVQAGDHFTTVTNVTSALGNLLQRRGDVVLGKSFSDASTIAEMTPAYEVLADWAQRSPDDNLIAGMADVIRGTLQREAVGPQMAADSMAAGGVGLISPAEPRIVAADVESLEGLPDGLADAWRKLKETGSGAISAFQESRRTLSDGTTVIGEISTFSAFERYLTGNFGCRINVNNHVGSVFLEFRKLPGDVGDLPGDLKKFFRQAHISMRDILEHAASFPNGIGVLTSFGEAFREFGEKEGRLGTHIFYIIGDYDALKATFEACRTNPKLLSRLVGYVFEWGNDREGDDMHRRVRVLEDSGCVGGGGYLDKRGSRVDLLRRLTEKGSFSLCEPDITVHVMKLHLLDAGEGYGGWRRFGFRHTGGNPAVEVKVLGTSYKWYDRRLS